jgi:hypothetical protein
MLPLTAALQRRLGAVNPRRSLSLIVVGVEGPTVLYRGLSAVVVRLADLLLTDEASRLVMVPARLTHLGGSRTHVVDAPNTVR